MEHSDAIYTPQPGERQLTARAVIAGCLVGSVVSCTNIYIGLKIGWTFGASIITAVLSYSAFSWSDRPLSVLETNIAQTSGSAAGYMSSAAGLVAAIPAMMLLGHHIPPLTLVLWAITVAFLGVFFAVPLRRQYVEIDKLRFPTGTATAETMLAMYSESGEALVKARVLLWSGFTAAVYALAYYFIPQLENPPLAEWFPLGFLAAGATWGFQLSVSPSLLGAGLLIGPRVVCSLFAGAVLAWGILGPLAQRQGWAPGAVMSYTEGARGWLLWPGVALMVSEALMSLALTWRTFLRAFTSPAALGDSSKTNPEAIPNSWWMGGLAAGSLLTMTLAHVVFGIAWYLTLVAIPLSAVLAAVAVRSTGETDINPVGGVGKVTQLVFGGLAPGQMTTNLMAAAITGGGASQASDMMQDLKTGYLLGASPRKQFLAQLIGICAGVVFVVPVYHVFTSAYKLGEDLPAPAAFAWKAMAELLAGGFDQLPPRAVPALALGVLVGVLLPLLRRIPRLQPYVPSGLAMGIGFIVPAYNSLIMFLGLVIWYVWRAINPQAVEKLSFAVAAGFIAGEGLMGIVNAVMTILKVPTITGH